jgi:hypothetical protein
VTTIDLTAPNRRRGVDWADAIADQRVLVGLVVAAIWIAIVALSIPRGLPIQTGLEAWCYWTASLIDPYARSTWTEPGAYVYSPAFRQVIAPLTALPWPLYVAVWTGLLFGALRIITGRRWFVLGIVVASMELLGGNISLFLGLAIVVGFRYPSAWAFVLLTKITPGVGLLWFAVRGEWRSLAIALGTTAAIVAVSFFMAPALWPEWIEVLRASVGKHGPSRSSSGGHARTGAGRSWSGACWRCRRSGTDPCPCSWRSSRCGATTRRPGWPASAATPDGRLIRVSGPVRRTRKRPKEP